MRKILIAEDDFFIRDVYKEIFTGNGYEVEAVADGDEALVRIKSQLFDMILLDIMMPKSSGIDVLSQTRKIETSNKNTPIFIITNIGEQNVIEEAFKMGMDGYMIKAQFTPQQIVDEINKFLTDKENLALS
jgi:CheY-like chemotaxis protein